MGLVAPRHVGSSQRGAQTRVPCIGRQILNHCATREALLWLFLFVSFGVHINSFPFRWVYAPRGGVVYGCLSLWIHSALVDAAGSLPKRLYQFPSLSAMYESSSYSISSTTTWYSQVFFFFFILGILVGVYGYLFVVLIDISFVNNVNDY